MNDVGLGLTMSAPFVGGAIAFVIAGLIAGKKQNSI